MFHSDFASELVCSIAGARFLDGRLAFVMSKCSCDLRSGIDLRMRIHAPPFEFQEAWKIMSNIVHGMQTLHAHGILHRDLKAFCSSVQGGRIRQLILTSVVLIALISG
ncbi:hypothetical protein KC19_11G173400 [Ceratodon purpureus]|uniref:Protein kinase domain-containing protein n=1 Tax=Ceratodon purpureus TaxID=3225 RepID=A0A8T0GLW1_CERPU|nr:hypothetical protein KC19_11G153700 [Ceratodon purpureus]KAG0558022.1 hypothetical protein KC19_11G173400 [Ceratodon purpureus]